MVKFRGYVDEAAYFKNLGFIEMMQFIDKASPEEQFQMDKIVKKEDWKAFKQLITKVLKVKLK